MTKLIYKDEDGFLEIVDASNMYIDPSNPTEIVINVYTEMTQIVLRFSDCEEAESFMTLLFECDKVNLYEIINDNPGIELTTSDLDMSELYGSTNYDEDEEGDEDDEC